MEPPYAEAVYLIVSEGGASIQQRRAAAFGLCLCDFLGASGWLLCGMDLPGSDPAGR